MHQEILRAHQVEKLLACSRSFVCRLLREGQLRGFKVGSQWRIYGDSLREYIKSSDNSCSA